MGAAGFEQTPESPEKTHISEPGDAQSDARPADPDLARVVDAWRALPPAIRRAVLALIGDGGQA